MRKSGRINHSSGMFLSLTAVSLLFAVASRPTSCGPHHNLLAGGLRCPSGYTAGIGLLATDGFCGVAHLLD
jgi:hypothetical protein